MTLTKRAEILREQLLDGRIDEAVEAQMKWVRYIVRRIIDDNPQDAFLEDDMVSEGYYNLVVVMQSLMEDERLQDPDFDVLLFMWSAIRRAIKRFAMYELRHCSLVTDVGQLPHDAARDHYRHDYFVELNDFIQAVCTDRYQMKALEMQISGSTFYQVVEGYGIHRDELAEINQRAKELLERDYELEACAA